MILEKNIKNCVFIGWNTGVDVTEGDGIVILEIT